MTITGLVNGVTYTFTVVAVNGIGSSIASTPSGSVTPVDPTPLSIGGGGIVIYSTIPSTISSPNTPLTPSSPATPSLSQDDSSSSPVSVLATLPVNIATFRSNAAENVIILQKFLNIHEGETLPLTGNYDKSTQDAVKRFQVKYHTEILDPVGAKKPTGTVGNLTRKKINALIEASNSQTSDDSTSNESGDLSALVTLAQPKFLYTSEDPTFLQKLQAVHGKDVVTEDAYKNTCETKDSKPYYRKCQLGSGLNTFPLFKDSVVCE